MPKKNPTPRSNIASNVSDYAKLFETLYAPSDKPSMAKHKAWLYAAPPKCTFHSTDVSGKWCIFRNSAEIDDAWLKTKKAVEAGQAELAKVSTALGAPHNNGNYVICVYTKDYRDAQDVATVRTYLRELGFVEELGYKRDIDTRNGVYGPDEWFTRSL